MAKLLGKADACKKFSVGRTKFDELVSEGIISKPQFLPGCTKPLWLESKLDKDIENGLLDEKPVEARA